MEHLKTQYSNIGTIGFFQNGMLHLLRYMEDGGILTLKDLAVSDVVNYICSWSQKHQRNVLCILRNIFQHFGREDLYFAVAGIHPYRTKRIVPMFTDNEIMSIEEVLSSPSVSHRDAAIFFLGLTTGMRAVDVVDLRLANIDWDNETIFFQQSKTGNAVCLPLTVDIGNSIYRYILEERPRVDDDHVFLRSQAPFIPLGGHSTCYYIVSKDEVILFGQVTLLMECCRQEPAEITVRITGYKNGHFFSPFSIHSTSCSSTTSESRKWMWMVSVSSTVIFWMTCRTSSLSNSV